MKTAEKNGLRREYRRVDLDKGVRGKFYARYEKGAHLVLLSSDVAAVFPNDEAVNTALRSLIRVAKKTVARTVKTS